MCTYRWEPWTVIKDFTKTKALFLVLHTLLGNGEGEVNGDEYKNKSSREISKETLPFPENLCVLSGTGHAVVN